MADESELELRCQRQQWMEVEDLHRRNAAHDSTRRGRRREIRKVEDNAQQHPTSELELTCLDLQ